MINTNLTNTVKTSEIVFKTIYEHTDTRTSGKYAGKVWTVLPVQMPDITGFAEFCEPLRPTGGVYSRFASSKFDATGNTMCFLCAGEPQAKGLRTAILNLAKQGKIHRDNGERAAAKAERKAHKAERATKKATKPAKKTVSRKATKVASGRSDLEARIATMEQAINTLLQSQQALLAKLA